MEEREFDNDGMVVKTPLVTLIGASNEIPTDEDNLGAFYDRFLLRYVTRYIEDDRDFVSMLKGSTTTIDSMLTEQDLLLAQIEVDNLPMSTEAYESVKIVWETLREDEGIFPSDRRFVQLLRVMAADSWLKNYNEIKAESVLVGQHILWTNPDEISRVKRVVINGVNPNLAKAEEILSAAKEALEVAMSTPTPQPQDLETMSALQEMVVELSTLSGVTTIFDQVVGMRITLGNKLSG
jgi:MoxR-like ATPase